MREGMMRNILFLSLIFSVFIYSGCGETFEKTRMDRLQAIGDMDLYTFSSDDQFFLSNAQPFILSANTSIEDALEELGRHLSKSYFSPEGPDTVSEIRFEVVKVQEIPTTPNLLRLAIINMIDRDRYAMNHFFQGSTGGQATFSMLGATFIQPHLDPPLLDGLIILYNGETLPELDHINLSGLLTPRLFKYVTKRAIYNTRRETVGAVQERVLIRGLNL